MFGHVTHVVFDRYQENSIKAGTRAKRKHGKDKGIKRNVDSREQRLESGTHLSSRTSTKKI